MHLNERKKEKVKINVDSEMRTRTYVRETTVICCVVKVVIVNATQHRVCVMIRTTQYK